MTQTETIAWPPPVKIKKHRRARYVKIRASKSCILEITVPYRFNLNELPSILEEKRNWITRQLLDLQSRQTNELPDKIAIQMMNEVWTVHYEPCDSKLEIIQRPSKELVLVGPVTDKELCKEKLIAWLKKQAKSYLVSKFQMLSHQLKLDFSAITIKNQKSLWGSCTRDKSINLNYKLIFLPGNLAEHVMIHELCHTKHLNHSEKFWKLVSYYDAACDIHRRELRHADKFIPAWID